jgi:hypothetical protein
VYYEIIFKMAKTAYLQLLRGLLVKAIDDPNEQWDDIVLSMVDGIFGYKDNA